MPTFNELHTAMAVTTPPKLVLLGCKAHGDNCSEALLNYYDYTPEAAAITRPRIGTLFLENFFYCKTAGVDESKITKSYNHTLLAKLKTIAEKVVGLETPETAPDGTPEAQQKFCDKQRCTVANPAWANLIMPHITVGAPNVVCCGGSHLVTVAESDKDCLSLESHFLGADLTLVVLGVAYVEEGEQYIPDGSKSGGLNTISQDMDD